MSDFDRELTGSLSRNDRKEKDTHADFKRQRHHQRRFQSLLRQCYQSAVIAVIPAAETDMPTLTVRNLDEDLVRRLRIRAAEHGRSAEAEHREILRAALASEQPASRQQAAERLAAFRRRVAGRGSPSAAELLQESRSGRMEDLVRKPGA
jgi:plasmid stability protein